MVEILKQEIIDIYNVFVPTIIIVVLMYVVIIIKGKSKI
jgi:hypothetical protein